MSGFDAVLTFEDDGVAESDGDDQDPMTDGGTQSVSIDVDDVGRLGEWLATRNLTIEEAALIIQTANLLVFSFVMYRRMSD